jgi:hypothetical protein
MRSPKEPPGTYGTPAPTRSSANESASKTVLQLFVQETNPIFEHMRVCRMQAEQQLQLVRRAAQTSE